MKKGGTLRKNHTYRHKNNELSNMRVKKNGNINGGKLPQNHPKGHVNRGKRSTHGGADTSPDTAPDTSPDTAPDTSQDASTNKSSNTKANASSSSTGVDSAKTTGDKDINNPLVLDHIDNERNYDYISAEGKNEDNKVLILYVPYNQQIKFDPGTLVYYQNIKIDTNFEYTKRGGFIGLLFGMFTSQFTGEEFYHNTALGIEREKNGFIALSQTFPGSIVQLDVSDKEGLILNYGAFLACTDNVDIISRNNFRFSEFFNIGSQETLIFPKAKRISSPNYNGPHKVWAQGFGAIQKIDLKAGDVLHVDNERFFACDDDGGDLYDVKPVGGLKSFFFGQVGYVMVFKGPRTVYVQSKGIMTYLSELRSKLNIKK